jgi:replicative DNA helicase
VQGDGKDIKMPRPKEDLPMVIPHNLEAEKAIIGAIMLDNAVLRQCELSVDDFHSPLHQMFYATFLDIQEDRAPIAMPTLLDKCTEEDCFTLSKYMNDAFTTANFSYYEELVKELSVKRKLQRMAIDLAKMAHESTVDEIVSWVRQTMGQLVASRGADLVPMSEIASELVEYVKRRRNSKGVLSGVPSGLRDIDDFTDGFQMGDMIIIAGRPGAGKSGLAFAIATGAAQKKNPVGIISLEMGKQQIGVRSLASISQVSMRMIRKGLVSDSILLEILNGARDLAQLPIWFSFASFDARAIEKTITTMVEEKDCKMIVVDYLQLVKNRSSHSREREVAEVSNLLKNAARANNIPIIALSQLNRNPEKEKRRPNKADLRESGAQEADADVIILLHPGEVDGTLECIFDKGRNIGTGTATLVWNKDTMTFLDYHRSLEE